MSNGHQHWQVRFIRISFRILVILCLEICIETLNQKVLDLQKFLAPPLVTLIGMVLVVTLFYFLISYIEHMTNAVLKYVIELGKTFKYRKTAVIMIILFLYVCAFFIYYRLWFNKWVFFGDLPALFSGKLIR